MTTVDVSTLKPKHDQNIEVTFDDVQELLQSNPPFKDQLMIVALRRRVRELEAKLANAEKEQVK